MKTHAALALLAAFALAAPGCATNHRVAPCVCKNAGHVPTTVSVVVEFTTDEKGNHATTKNKNVYVCGGDTVEFIWFTGALSGPVFRDGSPFDEIDAAKKSQEANAAMKSKKSRNVKKNAKTGPYEYTMQLQVENVFYDVDPRIEVME